MGEINLGFSFVLTLVVFMEEYNEMNQTNASYKISFIYIEGGGVNRLFLLYPDMAHEG